MLGAVVDDGDATGEDHVGEGVCEQRSVAVGVQPAVVVVVVREGAQGAGVGEERADLVVHVDEILGGAGLLVEAVEGVVDGVVKETAHEGGIAANVVWVTVEDLADGVHGGGLAEWWPVVLLDVLHRVDADAVEAKVVDQPVDPGLVDLADVGVSGVEVGTVVCDPAGLDGGLVVVVDGALRVVGVGVVQGGGGVSGVIHAHVVGHDISHDIHALYYE